MAARQSRAWEWGRNAFFLGERLCLGGRGPQAPRERVRVKKQLPGSRKGTEASPGRQQPRLLTQAGPLFLTLLGLSDDFEVFVMMTILYLVGGFFLVFMLLQYSMVLKMKLNRGKTVPQLRGQLGKKIKRGDRLLLYFFSPGCRACKPMTPVIDELKKKSERVFSINISQDMETAKAFGVMGTPATLVVEGGKIAEFLVGAQRPERLRDLLGLSA